MIRINKLSIIKTVFFVFALVFACTAWSQVKTWAEYEQAGLPEYVRDILKDCNKGKIQSCELMAMQFEPPLRDDKVQADLFRKKTCLLAGTDAYGFDLIAASRSCSAVGLALGGAPLSEKLLQKNEQDRIKQERMTSLATTFEERKDAISAMLDYWLDEGPMSIYDQVEALDYNYPKVLTGWYGTDYRELDLSANELKELPLIGVSFLKDQNEVRNIEKAVATLYLAALSVGGAEESVFGSKRWSTNASEQLSEGALRVQADSAYDWRYKIKAPLGVAAYLAGTALLNHPDYKSNSEIASGAYEYLWMARMNGVQDAAFLLNNIYDSQYGVPEHHIESDPLEAAWFRFHQVVYVCDTFFGKRASKNWLELHPLPPRQRSCDKARQEQRVAKAYLNERGSAERQAKALLLLGVLLAIGEMLPDTPYQPASANYPGFQVSIGEEDAWYP